VALVKRGSGFILIATFNMKDVTLIGLQVRILLITFDFLKKLYYNIYIRYEKFLLNFLKV
jgi:hypothetical protein